MQCEQKSKAGDGTRTHDDHVGNVVLYHLSYTRFELLVFQPFPLGACGRGLNRPIIGPAKPTTRAVSPCFLSPVPPSPRAAKTRRNYCTPNWLGRSIGGRNTDLYGRPCPGPEPLPVANVPAVRKRHDQRLALAGTVTALQAHQCVRCPALGDPFGLVLHLSGDPCSG